MLAEQKDALNKAKGQRAEAFAVALYQKANFLILETDLRVGRAQVDFVASRGNVIHFVEVKFRQQLLDGHHAINQDQLLRIGRAAQSYMLAHEDKNYQIDIMLIDRDFRWQRIDNIPLEGQ